MKSKQSCEKYFLLRAGHAAPSWDVPADTDQDNSALPVSPPGCPFPFSSLPSCLLMAVWEQELSWQWLFTVLSLLSPPPLSSTSVASCQLLLQDKLGHLSASQQEQPAGLYPGTPLGNCQLQGDCWHSLICLALKNSQDGTG